MKCLLEKDGYSTTFLTGKIIFEKQTNKQDKISLGFREQVGGYQRKKLGVIEVINKVNCMVGKKKMKHSVMSIM